MLGDGMTEPQRHPARHEFHSATAGAGTGELRQAVRVSRSSFAAMIELVGNHPRSPTEALLSLIPSKRRLEMQFGSLIATETPKLTVLCNLRIARGYKAPRSLANATSPVSVNQDFLPRRAKSSDLRSYTVGRARKHISPYRAPAYLVLAIL